MSASTSSSVDCPGTRPRPSKLAHAAVTRAAATAMSMDFIAVRQKTERPVPAKLVALAAEGAHDLRFGHLQDFARHAVGGKLDPDEHQLAGAAGRTQAVFPDF